MAHDEPAPASSATVRADAGLDGLFTLSTGEKIPDPRHERRDRHRLARAVSDAAWRRFRTMLAYKADRYGRDVNAARDILAEGLSVIACGGGVRPQRTHVRTGRSSAKQEPPGATQGIPVL